MSSESSTAFYKGVKFWLVLLLAAGLAALLWRTWRQEPTEVPPGVGCVLSAGEPLPDAVIGVEEGGAGQRRKGDWMGSKDAKARR